MKNKKSITKFIYVCIHCNKEIAGDMGVQYLCPDCSPTNTKNQPPAGVLKIMYDYHSLRQRIKGFASLKKRAFIDLLPIQSVDSLPKLRIGQTPLYSYRQNDLQNSFDSGFPFNVFFKDDSQNPTFSYKDRASALVSAYARENELRTIVAASTGNAGSSMAGICASQQLKAVIMVPESAPLAKISQVLMYGATLIPVKGSYDDAFELSLAATEAFGWYNRNTGYNPLTIEGKKSAAFELFEQMNGNEIDRIFIPVGDGVIISGIYKGFEDLLKLGIIEKIPVIVAVQSENSDNLVRNLDRTDFEIKHSTTLADSISVDVPRNFYMARQFIHQYRGEGITVSDEEIMEASVLLARNYGIFSEPAAAAAFAGLLKHHKTEKTSTGSNNIVMLTGSGLKDLNATKRIVSIPPAVDCNIDEVRKLTR